MSRVRVRRGGGVLGSPRPRRANGGVGLGSTPAVSSRDGDKMTQAKQCSKTTAARRRLLSRRLTHQRKHDKQACREARLRAGRLAIYERPPHQADATARPTHRNKRKTNTWRCEISSCSATLPSKQRGIRILALDGGGRWRRHRATPETTAAGSLSKRSKTLNVFDLASGSDGAILARWGSTVPWRRNEKIRNYS